MPFASRAAARSASRSATGERTGGAVQSLAHLDMVGQIATAIDLGRIFRLYGARMLPQLGGGLPGGGGAATAVLFGPVVEFGGRRGCPVTTRELPQACLVHG